MKIKAADLRAGMTHSSGYKVKSVGEVPGGKVEVELTAPEHYARVQISKTKRVKIL